MVTCCSSSSCCCRCYSLLLVLVVVVVVDCVMLSPGIVKPTRLKEEGEKLLEQTFKEMPKEATTEYRDMVNAFTKFQIEEPGTHVSEVCTTTTSC